MPDLSHRPTRYLVALASALTVAGLAAPHLGLRVGADPGLKPAQARAEQLEQRATKLQRQLDAAARRTSTASALDGARAVGHKAVAAVAGRSKTGTGSSSTKNASLPLSQRDPSCASYANREAAQQAFLAARVRLAGLDGDGDGLACEQLKSRDPSTLVRTIRLPATASDASGRLSDSNPFRPTPTTIPRVPTTPPKVAPTPLPVAPSKARIVASGHHFGLAAATSQEFNALEYSLKRNASMTGYFKGWDTSYDKDRVISAWNLGQIPVMTWESRPLANATDLPDPFDVDPAGQYKLKRIIDGEFDDYLTTYATDIKALGLPLVIRFDQEMNGNWFRWAEFATVFGNDRGDYVAAWRHIHDVFERVGANEYVVWLWSPNRVDNLTRFPAIDGYYPGDDYVDWVGMSGYYRPGDGEATYAATYTKTLDELRRVAPGKPIVLSEVGATEDGGTKIGWTESFFAGLPTTPDVIGFIWFNYAVTVGGHTNDWRIDSTPQVFDAATIGLSESGFGQEMGKKPVLIPQPAPPADIVPALAS